jgi:hypothetical protein
LLAYGQWFSPGTPASSTTKTGRHDIAEILLKVALNTKNQKIKSQKRLLQFCHYKIFNDTNRYREWSLYFNNPHVTLTRA